jgi:hypothetical protein
VLHTCENLAGIIGLVEALERFVRQPVFSPSQLLPLTNRLTRPRRQGRSELRPGGANPKPATLKSEGQRQKLGF